MPTRLTCWVETAKICNQSTEFRLWWVGSGLEFSQPASDRLDRNIGLYSSNPTHAHPYSCPLKQKRMQGKKEKEKSKT